MTFGFKFLIPLYFDVMFALSLALVAAAPVDVSFKSLVEDMWNLRTLAEYPNPVYVTRQASSYDRASQEPGNDDWFANKDWGNFLRDEKVGDRVEHVMADLKGPGVVVRYWSPNPAGVTRFYIDGSATPSLETKSADLLGGKTSEFPPPISETTSNGWSLYCPIAYQKSMKVTVDNSDNDAGGRMYYQIQYRTFDEAVQIEPFSHEAIEKAGLKTKAAAVPRPPVAQTRFSESLMPRSKKIVELSGPACVNSLVVTVPNIETEDWTDPKSVHTLLRSIRVKAKFDGENCIDTPLGDLMSTPVGINQLATMPASVSKDGTMILRLPMPFKSKAQLVFENTGTAAADLKVQIASTPYQWTDSSMHFKAQWLCYEGGTRPMRDLEFLNVKGKGVFIGCNVAISNPVTGWWGEGDEKIFIDDEAFPSTFGTGTEDYFGYGWSSPTLFMNPYHYQSRCDGPGTKGHSCIGRWQIVDRMPFTKSFKFDMELWHWVDCQMLYGRTAYWYAVPGGSGPLSDNPNKFKLPFIPGVTRVKGALEGEELKIESKSGGETEIQGFDDLSNGKQLWWRDGHVGDKLVLEIPMPAAGSYKVSGNFCFAKDYGVHKLTLGDLSKEIDFFGELGWKKVDLGTLTVPANTKSINLTVEIVGSNPLADPHHMFGLDHLILIKQ